MIQPRNKKAIVCHNNSYDYKQVLQYTSCYADHFSAEANPQKVLIFSDNTAEYFFALYGAVRCNAIVVPVDVQSTIKELAYIINDCRPEIIFISPEKREIVTAALEAVPDLTCKIVTPLDINIEQVAQYPVTEIPEGDPEQTMFIIYTSGTTGSPKGVMLSYKNVMFNVNSVSKQVPIYHEASNVMVLLPLHHSFPLIGTLVAPMYVGSTVYIAEGLSSESILRTLNEGKISLIIGVPRLYDTLAKGIMTKINARGITRMLYALADKLGSETFSKFIFKSVHQKFGGAIEYLVSGGAALSLETARVFKTLGFYVLEGYGMTETAPMISFTRPGRRKIGYAGDPLPNIEIKFSEAQEILVKGANVMQGYYQRPEETAEIIKDGWLHTGDMGVLDRYGLKLTGRIKEIIVTSNGKNINPEEIELELLKQSAFIKEVGVFLHQDTLQAIIVPQMPEFRTNAADSLQETFKSIIAEFNKQTMSYKRIKRFHLFSEELPKTRLGKLRRFKFASLIEETQEKKLADNLRQKSEVYLMLKTFIDNETGYQASGDDHFEIDLAMDSLSRVALLAHLEHSFGINLNENDLENFCTLNILNQYVKTHMQKLNHHELSWKEILSSKFQEIKLPKSGLIHFLMTQLFRVMLHLSYRYRGKGVENIPQEPCIIVANHRSALDGHIITSRMKDSLIRKTFLFAKGKHWRSPFARFMAVKNNIILMDINQNVRESLQQLSSVLKKGKNIIIFPEGTRSKDKSVANFKETFAILSRELNIPIVPVAISGSERAVYHSVKFPRLFAKIDVEFLTPIYPSTETDTAASLKEKVEKVIRRHLSAKS